MKVDGNDVITSIKQTNTDVSISNTQKIDKDTGQISEDKIQLPTDAEKKALPISEKFLIDSIEKANKAIEGAKTEFKFSIHKQTHEISVKVLDKDSGEVIREIPPEKVLDMVAHMWEMAGIIIDEKR